MTICHNLKGYDGHLIVKAYKKLSVDVIADTDEKYKRIKIERFVFLGSLQHLNSSLEKLVENLNGDVPYLKAAYPNDYKLLARKQVFMYEYIDSFDKFDETELPPITAFASSLNNGANISETDYKHAKLVYKKLGCKKIGDYLELYLKTDVLLLIDVFENYRKTSMENYGLDPVHYVTAPSLAWDALLKKTGQKLELLTDVDMYNFFESGIRGGVSTCGSLRHAKANNKYIDGYDSEKTNSYIMYMDINNQYGWAMCQKLPTHGFEWVTSNFDKFDEDGYLDPWSIQDLMGDDEGYTAEVDLDYPEELHDKHNDFPLAPESIIPNQWSEYMCEVGELTKLDTPKYSKVSKLTPNLHYKKNYVIHHSALDNYLKKGLKLAKVHRVLKYKESAWLKTYIDSNTELRKKAKSDFKKDQAKLMNVASFGKSMENVRNRIDVKLETEEKVKLRRVKNPRF